MESQGEYITVAKTQRHRHRRVLLFPIPLQGHINPMLQLACILHSKGFSITILHTHFNSPNPTNYPHFTFHHIPDDQIEIEGNSLADITDILLRVTVLNKLCGDLFRDFLARLISDSVASEEPIACLITDALWHFTQSVADSLDLPRIVLRTSSLSCLLVYQALPSFREKGYFLEQDYISEELVPEFSQLKIKDIPKIAVPRHSEPMYELIANMLTQTKVASGIIWNSFRELEETALAKILQDFPIPNFLIGPFHKYFLASSSSLLEQDWSSISWLDLQAPKSVLYVSIGSVATIEEKVFLEMAWGLANTNQPFLWVVRPGSVHGSEWLEALPDEFLETVRERGCIVKWAPQQEILAHPATGGFWTHNGWNSTLESICEGVPMICSPCMVDQPINARDVSEVWKIGLQLENGLERGEIESTIKRLMVDKEGEEIRERIMCLIDKVNLCLKKGGSSYRSLESLIACILSF